MFENIRQYLISLVVVIGMAVVYQSFVTPHLRPPMVKTMQLATMPPLDRFSESLKELFPDEDCWQRGGCKILKTVDGMLLFEEFVDLKDNKARLSPLSIVVGGGLKSGVDAKPIVIDAIEGAEIQFTRSLVIGSGPAPSIERGRVIGPVVVTRRGDDNGTSDLLLNTSNIGIDSKKIWTTDEFDQKSEGLSMRGRDLTLHLTKSGNEVPELERVELIYLYQLNYAVDEQKTMACACDGRVEYRFDDRTLVMRDDVSLVYRDGMEASTFACDTLECILADPEVQAVSDSPRTALTEQFEKITASGQPVVLKSGAVGAEFSAQNIEVTSGSGGRIAVVASGPSGVKVNAADWGGAFEQL